MEYYSSRNGIKIISIEEFYQRFSMIIEDFSRNSYFRENLGNSSDPIDSNVINRKAQGHIGINIYPFTDWLSHHRSKENIFDCIEFLFQFVSKPGEYGYKTDHTNWNYEDYLSYDQEAGKSEYLNSINSLLRAYDNGYELQPDGTILFIGDETVNFIELNFPEYNDNNVDTVIHAAIKQWKNKYQSIDDKKQAIIKLGNVFEYLKKSNVLETVLKQKDSSDLFNIANNFSIRHHNPDQKSDYDMEIWYDWIFQFYLTTCITVLKLIKKNKP